MQVTGIIENITSRQTQFGEMYDIVVDGQSYGNGKYAPRGVNIGDAVTFTAEVKGRYRNVARGTLRRAGVGDVPSAPSPSAAPQRMAVNDPKEKYWSDKAASDEARQKIISRQAALNTAIDFVEAAIKAEALALPAKAADKIGLLEAMVVRYAQKFHKVSTGEDMVLPEENTAKASARVVAKQAEDPYEDDPFAGEDLPPL